MKTIAQLENKIKSIVDKRYPYTNVIGLVRSMLAMGLLLTLFFTDVNFLAIQDSNGAFLSPTINESDWNFFMFFGAEYILEMKIAAILLLFLVITGYFPQITCLAHWWIASSFMFFSSVIDGGDQIHNNITLLLIPLCLTDPRINHWFKGKKRESALNLFGVFPIWVIKIQVAMIYFQASVAKYSEPEWANGTALYYWFNNSVFGSQQPVLDLMGPILENGMTVTLLTYSVLVLEIVLFAALFMSHKRRMYLLPLAVGFHFGIIVFHGIFSFFFSIASIAILYLLPTGYTIKLNFSWLYKLRDSWSNTFKLPNLSIGKPELSRVKTQPDN